MNIGDVVILSEEARRIGLGRRVDPIPTMPRHGIVRNITKAGVAVVWNGNRAAQFYHADFLEAIKAEEASHA